MRAYCRRPGLRSILIVSVVALLPWPALAGEAPPGLVRTVVQREAKNEEARIQYAFTQNVQLVELDPRGARMGHYSEAREVVFSESGERIERALKAPQMLLQRIRLTEEDFQDFREVQPFLFTEEVLWMYRTKVVGGEEMDGELCWALQVSPKQILDGQRLFQGRVWVSQKDFGIVRMAGKAVPQHYGKKENFFPAFTTIRKKVDGYWFPSITYGDDVLPFRSGAQRVRLTIEYSGYQRFGAESRIQFQIP